MSKEIVGFKVTLIYYRSYIITFENPKKHCDRFIVFLQSDPSVQRKSKYKPVIPLYDRYKDVLNYPIY